jgi:hypothetical protein
LVRRASKVRRAIKAILVKLVQPVRKVFPVPWDLKVPKVRRATPATPVPLVRKVRKASRETKVIPGTLVQPDRKVCLVPWVLRASKAHRVSPAPLGLKASKA